MVPWVSSISCVEQLLRELITPSRRPKRRSNPPGTPFPVTGRTGHPACAEFTSQKDLGEESPPRLCSSAFRIRFEVPSRSWRWFRIGFALDGLESMDDHVNV